MQDMNAMTVECKGDDFQWVRDRLFNASMMISGLCARKEEIEKAERAIGNGVDFVEQKLEVEYGQLNLERMELEKTEVKGNMFEDEALHFFSERGFNVSLCGKSPKECDIMIHLPLASMLGSLDCRIDTKNVNNQQISDWIKQMQVSLKFTDACVGVIVSQKHKDMTAEAQNISMCNNRDMFFSLLFLLCRIGPDVIQMEKECLERVMARMQTFYVNVVARRFARCIKQEPYKDIVKPLKDASWNYFVECGTVSRQEGIADSFYEQFNGYVSQKSLSGMGKSNDVKAAEKKLAYHV